MTIQKLVGRAQKAVRAAEAAIEELNAVLEEINLEANGFEVKEITVAEAFKMTNDNSPEIVYGVNNKRHHYNDPSKCITVVVPKAQ